MGVVLMACLVAPARSADEGGAGSGERIRQLRAADLSIRAAAAFSLIESGAAAAEAYPALVELLADDEALDHLVAARGLYARPRPAADAPALISGLSHDTKARVPAAWELSRIGPTDDPKIAEALVAALVHPDKHERNFVVLALAMSGVRDGEAVPALLRILADPGREDPPQRNYRFPRASAAIALGLIGRGAGAGVPLLAKILDDKSTWEVQRAANCFALGRIGTDAMAALPGLRRAENDPSPIVRTHATRAVQTAGRTAAGVPGVEEVGGLVAQVKGGANRVNARFAAGLRGLGEFAGKAKPIQRKGGRRGAPAVHESVALAIGFLDCLERTPTPDEIAAQDRAGALTDEVRLYLMALGGIQQGITPVLLAALEQAEQDPRVIAIRRLGRLGPAAKDAIPALGELRGDLDWVVRRETFLALRLIQP